MVLCEVAGEGNEFWRSDREIVETFIEFVAWFKEGICDDGVKKS